MFLQMINIAGFVICAIIIFFCGKQLTLYGDIIARKTGLGKAWVGLILLASVTSLPELVVGIGSSAIIKSADLAVGDVLGSCAFNLGILAVMDVFVPEKKSILATVSQSQVMAASMGIILVAMTGVGLLLPKDVIITPGLGLTSLSFIIIYFISMRLLYKFEIKQRPLRKSGSDNSTEEHITLKRAFLLYGVFAMVTIIVALLLPDFAKRIATQTHWGNTFTATLFLAASTSLPEIAVSFSAVKKSAVDLCVGNLLGSNIFNIFILALDDIWYTKGHILKDAADINLISVLFVILMSAIAIIGITYRSPFKRYRMAWDALLILAIYVLNMILLFKSIG